MSEGNDLIVFLIEQEAEKYSDAFESKGIAKESFIKGAKFMLNHLKPKKCRCAIPKTSFINQNLCSNCGYEIK